MAKEISTVVARISEVYFPMPLSTGAIDEVTSRVVNQLITLPQFFLDSHLSATRKQGDSEALAKLFFIALNRPPDYATFLKGKELAREGSTLSDLASIALSLPGSKLNFSQTNQQFVDNLAAQMFSRPDLIFGLAELRGNLVAQLNQGLIKRVDLLSAASNYEHGQLKYNASLDVALIAMAATGAEASAKDLQDFSNKNPLLTIRETLKDSGVQPHGTLPLWITSTNERGEQQLSITGTLKGKFSIDFPNKTSALSETAVQTNYKLVIASADGIQESVGRFKPSLLTDFKVVDFSAVSVGDSGTITLRAHDLGLRAIGAAAPNIFFGGSGADILIGGPGDDVLHASPSRDILTGLGGKDIFSLAPAGAYRGTPNTFTVISDFGNGADSISLKNLFGFSGTGGTPKGVQVGASVNASTRRSADIEALSKIETNAVIFIINSGAFVNSSGVPTAATASNVHSVFTNVTILDQTILPRDYMAVTYDAVNGADLWLISNHTSLSTIELNEVKLIGQVIADPTVNLLNQLLGDKAFSI